MTGNKDRLLLPPAVKSHLQSVLGDEAIRTAKIREAKSAQQHVLIVTLITKNNEENLLSHPWREALQQGRSNLVIRLWEGSARWWNLHSNLSDNDDDDAVVRLARAEVAGYRLAREALSSSPQLEIPQVLYFSHDSTKKLCCDDGAAQEPWACMSYVGPDSTFFLDCFNPTEEWAEGMIKIRPEFGFDEPHPRWGRVPVDQCLDYVFHVLRRFILPMHRYFLSGSATINQTDLGTTSMDGKAKPWMYKNMIDLYRRAHSKLNSELANGVDDRQRTIVRVLGQCIERLDTKSVTDVKPVLCHMDCQPQNLIFFRECSTPLPIVHSVLDWEEAAFADPRFELLLLCRKVCANRDQAQAVWDFYAKEMESSLTIGPIEPWLKLETVHSITTLVLQSMDLLGGGRNPWETKPDLLGKIEREFYRLVWLGWTFCEEAITRSRRFGEEEIDPTR